MYFVCTDTPYTVHIVPSTCVAHFVPHLHRGSSKRYIQNLCLIGEIVNHVTAATIVRQIHYTV